MNAENKETPPYSRTAIILVNWNGARDLLECLESLLRLRTPSFDVIVCDNDSSDGSIEKVLAWGRSGVPTIPESPLHTGIFETPRGFEPVVQVLDASNIDTRLPPTDRPSITLIKTGGNLGFAGGNNVGLRFAMEDLRYSHFWLLNTDTIVASESLDALVKRSSECPAAGMIGSTLLYYWFPEKVQALGGAAFNRRTTATTHIGEGLAATGRVDVPAIENATSYVVGASMFVTLAFVKRVGLMCEDYFLYFEEIDWAMRAKGLFQIAYCPNSIVYHKVGGSSTKVASVGALRYLYRNRLVFVARHHPDRFIPTLRTLVMELTRHLVKRRFTQAAILWKTLLSTSTLWRQGREHSNRVWR